ncbi:MAG TPA: c-type cytochrome [Xanthobacteraceae bacterium]|nr:c-type cytochrome [Xanthobacteraceae bacterium]
MKYWLAGLAIAQLLAAAASAGVTQARAPDKPVWTIPEVGALPRDAHGLQVREGRDLITATYAYIGPHAPDAAKRYAGNDLACTNCHLQAGTKKFGLPLFGLYEDFPQYSARTGGDISIEDRINSCMVRSMNGRPLPVDAPEMQAMVAYIKFISSGVAPGQRLPGLGTGHMPELKRAASSSRGAPLYASTCAACHNTNGSGLRNNTTNSDLGYYVPPLWGPDTYNDGAGMARLITFANFIHFNMPHGTDYVDPQLSIANAWDIAAYVLSQPRPHLKGLEHDFPDLLKKPVDAPYGPYADHFSERAHKYGPFGPIEAALARLERQKH